MRFVIIFPLIMILYVIIYISMQSEGEKTDLILEDGYYQITSRKNIRINDSILDESINDTSLLNNTKFTISKNCETGLYQIRFYPSGKLLGVINDYSLISYIDSIVNMEYKEIPNVQYEWSIFKNEEGGFFIYSDRLALSYDNINNKITLSEFAKTADQIWTLEKIR